MKYLNVSIKSDLKFNDYIKRISSAPLSKYKSLHKLGNSIWSYSSQMLRILYRSVVEPAWTYASSIWLKAVKFKSNCKKLQVQKHFIVKILKSWKTISFEEAAFLSGILLLK